MVPADIIKPIFHESPLLTLCLQPDPLLQQGNSSAAPPSTVKVITSYRVLSLTVLVSLLRAHPPPRS